MEPYKVHLDNWTVAMYATDDGRLTFTVSNGEEGKHYLTRVVGNVKLRRYYIGEMCAGELRPSPFPTYRDGRIVPEKQKDKPMTKEAILAKEGPVRWLVLCEG